MLSNLVKFSIKNKLTVLLLTSLLVLFGIYSARHISIGAVPDVTNNQVQIITTSRNLSTEDIELFITYPIELEMGNLPGVKEIRSVSKFGLSVVTIVFEEDMGTFLPRQLISEKIISASKNIPDDFGEPEMGPISTGLGEIYQYILDVEPEFQHRYTAEDLRTIQDWIIKRQLTGIPGVVEVNTWGGYLKQYEVAINTAQLNAMSISAHDVFRALESNNGVAGGAYIEKNKQSYFIRGEGLIKSIADIENIVVSRIEGLPVYVKDVAKVQIGHAHRFGAITGNGEGEKVLGQIMMLKNANSKEVIEAVKEKIKTVSSALPEGVYINGFLDRSELINKTTTTIAENLILGCLIVIFVVVLILGNLRSGIVVASVIPLSLLFALSMMYLFGIDANLMSLGAIDFGIIIDGAVIIVEFIGFNLVAHKSKFEGLNSRESAVLKNELVISGTSKMMNSAVFGQLIILIVFIPVLSLSGVEGKMFKPMALSFSFALIGAMILCFTYVPVISSMLLKYNSKRELKISAKLMQFLLQEYDRVIHKALNYKNTVITTALGILFVGVMLFNSLGAEFVPTLDEGDFVIQPVLKTGTSLGETIKITTEIERILLKSFPEVKQVVSRIGAAEVPTDPMSMEESDIIIVLNDRDSWTTATSKPELAEKFKEAISVIPQIEEVEFTQPIEMRFNELITGVRADIAIKVYGEDLQVLASKSEEISKVISHVDGAADITVEKIAGLPEMRVTFDRMKVARYGLNIADLNDMIATGFGGKLVGNVFEGERRFDLVVRLEADKRKDLDNLKQLYVDLPSGNKVPMRELARIEYTKSAAKIARDNTRRRVVISVNVRNRDLQSVVDDLKTAIDNKVSLPVGYSIDYGGQFENLESARNRLLIAVPIALVLIFFMLLLAFKSIKEVLIVYTAIPLSAVGGIVLLWLRDMPFSISAGIGFIALFGIAVLNGIVLIEHLKSLNIKDFNDSKRLVVKGAKDRLRAVVLTAAAAAMGFFPMAFSTNVGAEVQRPLATVVIGGLVSATVLTLVVIPVLYDKFIMKNKDQHSKKPLEKFGLLGFLWLFSFPVLGQTNSPVNLDELLTTAYNNNLQLKASALQLEQTEYLKGAAQLFDGTEFYYHYDENNLAINDRPIGVFGIQQGLKFPTVFMAEKRINKINYQLSESAYQVQFKTTTRLVTMAYYDYQIALEKKRILSALDSLFSDFARIAKRRYELGETNYLEKITAASKQRQINLKLGEALKELENSYLELKNIVRFSDTLEIKKEQELKILVKEVSSDSLPEIRYYEERTKLFSAKTQLEKNKRLPDLNLEYFQGTNSGLNNQLIGYQFGIKIPILFGGQSSKIRAAKVAKDLAITESQDYTLNLKKKKLILENQLEQIERSLFYYETEGNQLSEEIINTASISYDNGEINFYEYIQSLESGFSIQLEYLNKIKEYNTVLNSLNFLTL
jgi:cobalt-zinc-cadmium resistance protein CzcA